MKKKLSFLMAVILILLAFSFARASEIKLDVKEHTLKNGLKVLIIERHDIPTFTALIQYNVGSVYESRGITGAAHLLEHMLFKGTKKIGTWNYEAEAPIMKKIDALEEEINIEYEKLQTAYGKGSLEKIKALKEEVEKLQAEQGKFIIKNELDRIYQENGSSGLNAFTWYDVTQYHVSLPSNRLELWFFLEADRMENPVLREFYSERDVVYEERRMRIDTSPYGKMWEEMGAAAFYSLPYHNYVIGWPGDIATMSRKQVEDFYKKYYSPNNAVVVIIGDIKEEEVMKLMKKYFEVIPSSPRQTEVITSEIPQTGERRVEVEFDAQPQIRVCFHGPKFGDDDQYVLDIIGQLLSGGRTSRYYKKLVEDKEMALFAQANRIDLKYSNFFMLAGAPKDPYTAADLEKEMLEALELLKKEKVSDWELQKVKNQIEAAFIEQLSASHELATTLAFAQNLTGDWRNFDTREKYKKVTSEDIIKVANKYFKKSNRTVITLVKKEKEAD